MSCSYCFVKSGLYPEQDLSLSDDQINRLVKYISLNNNGYKDTVVFFGGEPLLKYDIIGKFIKRTKNLNLSYKVYTNGLLLNSIPLEILNSLDTILVSVDGDKKAQEKYRGIGTYDQIIDNLKTIKPLLHCFVIGRVTVEEETNIYLSVTNLINYTDAVHWQIVNKPTFDNNELFIENYKQNLNRLFEYWLNHLKSGKLLRIIPFQAITSSFLFNYKKDGRSFRCGVGSNFQTIDMKDENIYWCDEYIGDPKGVIGNISNHRPINLAYTSHKDIFKDCQKCEVSDICLGRCKKNLLKYSYQQNKVYCELTRYLIQIISNHLEEIKNVVEKNNYDLKKFFDIPYCTEEIP